MVLRAFKRCSSKVIFLHCRCSHIEKCLHHLHMTHGCSTVQSRASEAIGDAWAHIDIEHDLYDVSLANFSSVKQLNSSHSACVVLKWETSLTTMSSCPCT